MWRILIELPYVQYMWSPLKKACPVTYEDITYFWRNERWLHSSHSQKIELYQQWDSCLSINLVPRSLSSFNRLRSEPPRGQFCTSGPVTKTCRFLNKKKSSSRRKYIFSLPQLLLLKKKKSITSLPLSLVISNFSCGNRKPYCRAPIWARPPGISPAYPTPLLGSDCDSYVMSLYSIRNLSSSHIRIPMCFLYCH